MTIEQFIIQQREILRELERENKPLRIAAQASHVQAVDRIFGQSKDVNGNTIEYKFPKGRTNSKGKIRPRDGAYSKAYAEFRDKRGRQVNRVDFVLDGDFRSDYANSEILSQAKPIRITPNEYQVQLRRGKPGITHAELREVFENDYYKTEIFTLSKEEIETFFETAELELANLVR